MFIHREDGSGSGFIISSSIAYHSALSLGWSPLMKVSEENHEGDVEITHANVAFPEAGPVVFHDTAAQLRIPTSARVHGTSVLPADRCVGDRKMMFGRPDVGILAIRTNMEIVASLSDAGHHGPTLHHFVWARRVIRLED